MGNPIEKNCIKSFPQLSRIHKIIIVLTLFNLLFLSGCASNSDVHDFSVQVHPTSDSDSIDNAKKLLNYLYYLPEKSEKKILSGQDIGTYDAYQGYYDYITGLRKRTGKLPAIIGTEYFAGINEGFFIDTDNKTRLLTEYWNSGGLVELHAHFPNPWTQGSVHDLELDDGNYSDAYTPGTEAYEHLKGHFDNIANELLKMQQDGVVVLFRPFHEVNGGWFWWYSEDPDNFIRLWRHWHDYLSKEKRVHNLLYIYSPSPVTIDRLNTRGPQIYYPGNKYVDITGLDLYSEDLSDMPYVNYTNMIKFGKPFCFGELGGQFPPDEKTKNWSLTNISNALETLYPKTVYWLSWSSWVPGGTYAMEELPDAEKLFNHPLIASREDIDFRHASDAPDSIDNENHFPTENNKIKIGLIDNSPGLILGQSTSFEEAAEYLKNEHGDEFDIIRIRGLYGYRLPGAIQRLREAGCRIIILDIHNNYENYLNNAATIYKDTEFILESYSTTPDLPNIIRYGVNIDEWHYLTGLIAGTITENNIIGCAVYSDTEWSIRQAQLFSLGVSEVNPEARIMLTFSNGNDLKAVQTLIKANCDVLNSIANNDSVIKELLAESKNGRNISAFSQSVSREAAPEIINCSMPVNTGLIWTKLITNILSSEKTKNRYWFGIKDGVIRIGAGETPIFSETAEKLKAAAITDKDGFTISVYEYIQLRYRQFSRETADITPLNKDIRYEILK